MKPYPRANTSEGDGVTLSADLYNRMVDDIERLDRLAVMPPLFLTSGASGATIGLRTSPAELALVVIIGTETGGGRYQGSILYGNSTGNTSNIFQFQPQTNQTATDGPAPLTNSNGSLVNNALVINVMEPLVGGSHLLWGTTGDMIYATGRVMGFTSESTPRLIVYIETLPIFPVIAQITGMYETLYGGLYYGRIVQGQFATGTNVGYSLPLSGLSSSYLPNVDNCWITNNWEQTYGPPEHNALAVGTYVWGLVAGFPAFSTVTSTNSSASNIWYQVYTWFPPQSAALTHPIQNLVTSQTANSTYAINEQTMLNNLKTDVTNIQASLSNLYANLKAAGYTL
jgi:hypothetical protein